jgi:hypothetical protein
VVLPQLTWSSNSQEGTNTGLQHIGLPNGSPMRFATGKQQSRIGGGVRYCIAICTGLVLCLFIGPVAFYAAPSPNPVRPAWAAGNHGQGRGNQGRGSEGKEYGRGHGHSKRESVTVAFSVHDQEIIRSYFREYPSDLPPGLAKRGGNLPPGLEKQLRRNGSLPPGLQKRLQPCPIGLEHRLPPLPEGYSRKMLGTQLLILDSMNVIRDIMILSR